MIMICLILTSLDVLNNLRFMKTNDITHDIDVDDDENNLNN